MTCADPSRVWNFSMGMRAMDLEVRTWYGAPGYFVLGACHHHRHHDDGETHDHHQQADDDHQYQRPG